MTAGLRILSSGQVGLLSVPADRFLAAARGMEPGLAGIGRLAEAMGLSLTAAAIRYARLSEMPCAVVKWSGKGGSWSCLSPAMRTCGLNRPVGLGQVPADAPTRRALEASGPAEIFQAGTTAAGWFVGVRPGGLRDILLLEQAVSLGRFGALTFLQTGAGQSGSFLESRG